MKKTKFQPVYKEPNKTNISKFIGKSGVYLIKKTGEREILYIGFSASDIYKAITRHFQSWEDKNQVRVTYPQNGKYSIRIVTTTAAKASILERALILKHKPKDNPNKYESYIETDKEKRDKILVIDEYLSTEEAPF